MSLILFRRTPGSWIITKLCEFKPGASLKVLFGAYIGLYRGCRGYIGCRADHNLGVPFLGSPYCRSQCIEGV